MFNFDIKKIKKQIKDYISFDFMNIGSKKEVEIYNRLNQLIINSSEPEEIKNKIVKEMAIALEAYRCFLVEYESSTGTFMPIANSYTPKREAKSMLGVSIDKEIPFYAMKQKYMKYLSVLNWDKFAKKNNLKGSNEDIYAGKYNLKATFTARLEFGDIFLGIVAVHYDEPQSKIKAKIIQKVLCDIAEHLSIALYLSRLYAQEKGEKEKEKLLNSLITLIFQYDDIPEVINKVFDILAKSYSVLEILVSLNTKYFEGYKYKYNCLEGGFTQIQRKGSGENSGDIVSIYKDKVFDVIKNKVNYIPYTENFVLQNNLENTEINRYFINNNIKSLLLVPFFVKDVEAGLLVIHYDRKNPVLEDDIQLVRIVVHQLSISIARYQGYENQRLSAQRELVLRKITETTLSSLGEDEILYLICEETAKVFNVQRVSIAIFSDKKNITDFDIRQEYKVSPNIKGVAGTEKDPQIIDFWIKNIISQDVIEYDHIENSDTPDYFKKTYKALGIKSIMACPIKKGKDIWGALFVSEYNYNRRWTTTEKNLLKTIADQVYITMNQAELYSEIKRQTEIQNAILNNIPFMAWLKDKRSNLLAINKVFAKMCGLTIEDIVGKTDFDLFPTEHADLYVKEDRTVIETKQLLHSEDIILGPEGPKWHETWKSPVFNDKGDVVGTVGLSQDISERKESELELLKKQELIVKKSQREILLRNITNVIRESLDINEIKKNVVNEIGKTFDVDRCYFRSYDRHLNKFLAVDIEYRKSEEIPSLIGKEPDQEGLRYFIEELNKRKEAFRPISVDDTFAKGTPIQRYFDSAGIKIDYAIPLLDRKEGLTYLVLHYTRNKVILEDEDKNFLKILGQQIVTALDQARLFKEVEYLSYKEKVLREIISDIKLSHSASHIYNYLLIKLHEIYNLDLLFFVEPTTSESPVGIIKYEYNKLPDAHSLKGQTIPENIMSELFLRNFSVNDVRSFYPTNEEMQNIFKNYNIRSFLSCPLVKLGDEGKQYGVFVLVAQQEHYWTQNEESLLEEIMNAVIPILWEIEKKNEMDELKNTFILTLAHDLEVPLVGERRALEFIVNIPPGQLLDNYKDMIAEVIKDNENLSLFLKRLIDSYNYELGRKKNEFELSDLNKLIYEVIDEEKEYIEQKSLILNLNIQDNLPLIEIDVSEIKKVLITLLKNAIEHSNEQQQITIDCSLKDNIIMVSIIDNGPGIPREIQQRIFKRYEMAVSTERKIGAGLGLYLAKQVVEAHDGNMWFVSVEGTGTTFSFTLPLLP